MSPALLTVQRAERASTARDKIACCGSSQATVRGSIASRNRTCCAGMGMSSNVPILIQPLSTGTVHPKMRMPRSPGQATSGTFSLLQSWLVLACKVETGACLACVRAAVAVVSRCVLRRVRGQRWWAVRALTHSLTHSLTAAQAFIQAPSQTMQQVAHPAAPQQTAAPSSTTGNPASS